MRNIKNHDINNVAVVTVGFSLLTMVAFAIRHIFRIFTQRKVSPVDDPNHKDYRRASELAGAAAAAPALESSGVTDYTRPIDPSEDNPHLTMFASEAVLRRDWDSPEEDEAWANL